MNLAELPVRYVLSVASLWRQCRMHCSFDQFSRSI